MATQASGASSWLTLNGAPLGFSRDDENLDAQAHEQHWNIFRITQHAPDDIEIRIDEEPLESERYGRWDWKPRGFAGLYQVQVRAPGFPPRNTKVRVLPSKLSYARYRQMLLDINQIAADLLFQLRSPAAERALAGSPRKAPSALRDFKLVSLIVGEMRQVMAEVRRSPQETLSERTDFRLLHQLHRFSSSTQPIPGPSQVLPNAHQWGLALAELPQVWAVQESVVSYDCYENRLLKHFLWHQLLPRIYSLSERAEKEIERRKRDRQMKLRQGWEDDETEAIEALEAASQSCGQMLNWCIAWGSEPFLQRVGTISFAAGPTQVLQKHPYYSRFYRLYLRFQQELRLDMNAERYVATLSLRKLAELYEIWAVFRATDIMLSLLIAAGYEMVSQSRFFETRDDQFQLELDPQASIELARGSQRVVIRYQPLYPPAMRVASGLVSDRSYQLTPDLAVELWQDGEARRTAIFDAKYRVADDGAGYLLEDIEKMDHYYNAIRWKPQNPRQRPVRVVWSAYILYPGEVLEHNLEQPEVGALPMTPDENAKQRIVQPIKEIMSSASII